VERIATTPRADWVQRVEAVGLHYHSLDDGPYWDESAYYRFTPVEVDELERATYALDKMCLEAVEHVVQSRWFAPFGLPEAFHDYVVRSWETDERTIYGRFDLAFDGRSAPRLLEYNADTPTALLEAAVVQWFWMKECQPDADQFNSLHERLIEAWRAVAAENPGRVDFVSLDGNVEDFMTVSYLRDTAVQAGLDTAYLPIERIGWDSRRRAFVDLNGRPMTTVFKLYPWEWLLKDRFAPHLLECATRWLEAPWKMLLSNKAILPVLCGLFPQSPYLLRTAFDAPGGSYVRKPIQGREGANLTLVVDGKVQAETPGPYGDQPCVYQEWHQLPCFDGNYPVVGSWMVNGYACGIGIREDRSPLTQNTSRFVPHVLVH
jgi:glutathionylspermidine synthase